MTEHHRKKPLLLTVLLLTVLLLVGLTTRHVLASREVVGQLGDGSAEQPVLVRALDPRVQTACPSAPSGLPNVVERGRFCVYYSDNTTDALATNIADYTDDYWDRFEDDFGFQAPSFSDKMGVRVSDTAGCNGSVSPGTDFITVRAGCNASSVQMMQNVVGHELFHQVQLTYDFDSLWFHEGTSRLIEDQTFADRDDWANALGAPFSFNIQANTYLASTNSDITSDPMRYNSALWWKYYTEQFGSVTTEPEVGIDALLALWQATVASDDIAAVNSALSSLGAGMTFDDAFRNFTVANWTKDLNAVPDPVYGYVDDNPPAPVPFNSITPNNGGTINVGSPAQWNNQNVSRYGASYYQATPGNNCAIISASFHRDSGPNPFYHIVTDQGGIFHTHKEGSGDDWTQSFFNDGITRVVAIAGAQGNSAQVDISISCADPVIDIQMPNSGAPVYVGPHDNPDKFLVQLFVTNGSSSGPVVAGLQPDSFEVEVGGEAGTIVTGGFIQEQYWLVVEAPNQSADGSYDLTVSLSGGGAVDTKAGSVIYDPELSDHVLVIDRSGSMGYGSDPRLPAAQDAAAFYVDITRDSDGLAVVPYNEDVSPSPFAISPVNNTVRNNAKSYINSLTASGLTSIGDGLGEAVVQRNASSTGNPRCSFVLLSDGMENSSQFWADVRSDVIDTECPVTSVAFGPESSETLMQEIATDTGGIFFFSDVYVSATTSTFAPESSANAQQMALDLSSVYEYAQADGEGRERLLEQRGMIGRETTPRVHEVYVDGTSDEVLFALDWDEKWYAELVLELRHPDGTIITPKDLPYTFADQDAGYLGWRIKEPAAGKWEMIVSWIGSEEPDVAYQVISSAHTDLLVGLLLPAVQQLNSPLTGQKIPVVAHLTGQEPLLGASVIALIDAPDGSETQLPLYDDGEHGDGAVDDGFYGNFYTLANQANNVYPQGENEPEDKLAQDEGGYRVKVVAEGLLLDSGDPFRREALGGFAVLESPDSNENRLPDAWEEEYGVNDPEDDPDEDGLPNYGEYQNGTNPLNPDTDGGGESDGSEVNREADPLDPQDDGIKKPIFIRFIPLNKLVRIIYDIVPGTVNVRIYRSTSVMGPWSLLADEPVGLASQANGAAEGIADDGVYEDTTVENGITYYYRLVAVNGDGQESGAVGAFSEQDGVTPLEDPFPPEANLLINGGAWQTTDPNVLLNFVPASEEEEYFEDITQVMLSNDPHFVGASWQPFQQDIPWALETGGESGYAEVYARFRDGAGNESAATAVATIYYESLRTRFLPLLID